MTTPHDVTIVMDGPAQGKVIVDGKELCVKEFSLKAGINDLTRLSMTILVKTVNKVGTESTAGVQGAFDGAALMAEIDEKIAAYRKKTFRRLVDRLRG